MRHILVRVWRFLAHSGEFVALCTLRGFRLLLQFHSFILYLFGYSLYGVVAAAVFESIACTSFLGLVSSTPLYLAATFGTATCLSGMAFSVFNLRRAIRGLLSFICRAPHTCSGAVSAFIFREYLVHGAVAAIDAGLYGGLGNLHERLKAMLPAA